MEELEGENDHYFQERFAAGIRMSPDEDSQPKGGASSSALHNNPAFQTQAHKRSANPFKRFFYRLSRLLLKRRSSDSPQEWIKKNQELVKRYGIDGANAGKGAQPPLTHSSAAASGYNHRHGHSIYHLIKQKLLPSNDYNDAASSNSNENAHSAGKTKPRQIIRSNFKNRESSEPIKTATAASGSNGVSAAALLDVSSPLLREEWKNDGSLILEGKYEHLGVTSFPSKYQVSCQIGQGSFGFVLKGRRLRDDCPIAVKFILKRLVNKTAWVFNPELGMVPLEVHFLQTLSHPGIVQFLDYFDDGKYVYLVTEIHGISWNLRNPQLNPQRNPGLKGAPPIGSAAANEAAVVKEESPCDLFECIECHYYLPEETIHHIFVQLYDVVRYLAEQNIVHRDLKDENVVVDADYRIKIIDFGSASLIPRLSVDSEGWFEKFNGTLAFAPPEVVRGLRYKGSESEAWTLGILLFTMAFRHSPFPDSQAILYGRLDFPFEEDEPGNLMVRG